MCVIMQNYVFNVIRSDDIRSLGLSLWFLPVLLMQYDSHVCTSCCDFQKLYIRANFWLFQFAFNKLQICIAVGNAHLLKKITHIKVNWPIFSILYMVTILNEYVR